MARGTIPLDRPVAVGILNITPDSFSDGGAYMDPAAAVAHVQAMVEAGAGMIDIGAESTRPGRPEPVPATEEWRRLEPVVREIARQLPHIPISIDTVKATIARLALAAGAWAINDVSGLRLDPAIADVCAQSGAGLILMHSRGSISDMATYDHARYADVGREVEAELGAAVQIAIGRGVKSDRIALDPGLGFAKTPEQSLAALDGLPPLVATGHAVMVGPSRKRFLSVLPENAGEDRDRATAVACVRAYALGARLFRVHAVAPVVEALSAAHATRAA